MRTWFVVYCKPKKDAVAELNLVAQGYNVYRPVINRKSKTKVRDQKAETQESMFPRYLFLEANTEIQSVYRAIYTSGVVGFVRFGERFPVLDDSIVNEIRGLEAYYKENCETGPSLKKNDLVYLSSIGFDNIKASFVECKGKDRALVLVELLGQLTPVTVHCQHLHKAAIY